MAFSQASKKAQAALRRITPNRTGDSFDKLTLSQQLDNWVAVSRRLHVFLAAYRRAVLPVDVFERARLLEESHAVTEEIKNIKAKLKEEIAAKHKAKIEKQQVEKLLRIRRQQAARGLNSYILDILKPLVDPIVWRQTVEEAKRQFEEDQK